MAKTQGERIEELTRRLGELEAKYDRLAATVELQIQTIAQEQKVIVADAKQLRRDVTDGFAQHGAKHAAHETAIRALEKNSDRSWGLTEKTVVGIVTFLAGAVLMLIVQSLFRK